MRPIKQSSRARGGNRGGVGGGYERTDPDYDSNRMKRLRAEYASLEPRWRQVFLDGLSKFERKVLLEGDRR